MFKYISLLLALVLALQSVANAAPLFHFHKHKKDVVYVTADPVVVYETQQVPDVVYVTQQSYETVIAENSNVEVYYTTILVDPPQPEASQGSDPVEVTAAPAPTDAPAPVATTDAPAPAPAATTDAPAPAPVATTDVPSPITTEDPAPVTTNAPAPATTQDLGLVTETNPDGGVVVYMTSTLFVGVGPDGTTTHTDDPQPTTQPPAQPTTTTPQDLGLITETNPDGGVVVYMTSTLFVGVGPDGTTTHTADPQPTTQPPAQPITTQAPEVETTTGPEVITLTTAEAPEPTTDEPVTTPDVATSTFQDVGTPETSTPDATTAEATATAQPTTGTSGMIPDVITYSPYNDDSSCKDFNAVLSDLTMIKGKGINSIRMYGTDCGSIQTVEPAALQVGLTISQGFWISDAGVDSIDDGVDELISWATENNQWSLFTMFLVGNEAVQSGFCSVDDLLNKVQEVKSKLQQAGFTGPVATAEPPVTFEQNPSLCQNDILDFVGINSHAYFDTFSSADQAGSFVAGQIQLIQQTCNGKRVYVTETGYPSAGIQNGGNIPSPENQAIAIQSLFNSIGSDAIYFTTYNDLWKDPGPYGIEQSFGIIQLLG